MKWEGMQDFYAALRKLPVELRDDAADIITTAAEDARTAIYQEYAQGDTGNLRKGLYVKPPLPSLYGMDVILISRAAHAWLWDNGSEARHYTTKNGKRHATGRMWGKSSPPHTFIKHVIRHRNRMFEDLVAMMEQHGLWVTGSPYDAAA